MAGLLLHESLALVIYGCLHVCLSFILIPKSCIKCPQQSKVVSTASGFSTPFSINMLSHALGLGLNTYGLRFIVKDLIEAKLLQKDNDCTSVMCMFSLVVSYNLFLVYTLCTFTREETEFALELVKSFGQKDTRKTVGRFGGSLNQTDCSRVFGAKKKQEL